MTHIYIYIYIYIYVYTYSGLEASGGRERGVDGVATGRLPFESPGASSGLNPSSGSREPCGRLAKRSLIYLEQ